MSAPRNPLDDPRITAYVLGELEGTERAAFEHEAASHRELAAEIENVRRTVAELSEALLDEVRPAPELSADQRAALAAAVESSPETDAPIVVNRLASREISGTATRRRWAALTPVALALAAVAAVLVHVSPAPPVTSLAANNTFDRTALSRLSDQDSAGWMYESQAFSVLPMQERKLSVQDGAVSERLRFDAFQVDGPTAVERFSNNAPTDSAHAGFEKQNHKETGDPLDAIEQEAAGPAPPASSESLGRSWNRYYDNQFFQYVLPAVLEGDGEQKRMEGEAAPLIVPLEEMNSDGVAAGSETSLGLQKSEAGQKAGPGSMDPNAKGRGVIKWSDKLNLNVKQMQTLEEGVEEVDSRAEGESKEPLGRLAPLPSTEARQQASCDGKYSELLDKLTVPADARRFGRFFDYGRWEGTIYADRTGLPPAYWVYVAPDWYLWGESNSQPTVE